MSVERGLRLPIIATALSVALMPVTAAERALGAEQRFVPQPATAFEDFTALREPRAELPVGALWVQGHGPYGSGAAADNLETVRSLSGFTVNRNLQLSLTLGLFNLLGLDPSLRNQVSARFSDLSIVRVKDPTRLEGPTGAPRIYEALKAGTITLSTERNLGLNVTSNQLTGLGSLLGRGPVGSARTYALEGRDMFIAYRVVTPTHARRHVQELRLGRDAVVEARSAGHRVRVDATALKTCLERSRDAGAAGGCSEASPVVITYSLRGVNGQQAPEAVIRWKLGDPVIRIPLSIPTVIAGRLVEDLVIDLRIQTTERRLSADTGYRLADVSEAIVALEGNQSVTLQNLQSRSW